MKSQAVVFQQPRQLSLQTLDLSELTEGQIRVAVEYSGISTGTERLLWDGSMPAFPGMGYPLVPGYESVGRVVEVSDTATHQVGQRVFVPGASCLQGVRSLFGGTASQLVVNQDRVVPVEDRLGANAVLLALAATAYHAVSGGGKRQIINPPDLIVGHGVMGRLLARMTVASGAPAPTVWDTQADRLSGAQGYVALHPQDDPRKDYKAIYDVSGDSNLLDQLIQRLAPGGEVVLAGFYKSDLHFAFAPAFMREATIRTAAEWKRPDLLAVNELVHNGRLSLDGLITHQQAPARALAAYEVAFGDAACLKMILDWSANA
ncbi:chlorophyll synthesis pathway protein BchC [Rhodoferax lacus]|uniref:Chlorophyll synthesis pathway protein BchC n=1 Tax=Rhodoferax lacus TaxID=2184758 RepID=A0A3E1RCL5_9BURK|nr:chlorophyll synthesis pathway protein BchC [Rhodoferax lacus]RFO97013.1 chlorophyll synthesis pathway protein BchC [Rhodoferax lacus]